MDKRYFYGMIIGTQMALYILYIISVQYIILDCLLLDFLQLFKDLNGVGLQLDLM